MVLVHGVARRIGAAACTVSLTALCLGATAPASLADDRERPGKHGKQSAEKLAKHRGEPATHAKKAKPAKAKKSKAGKAKKPGQRKTTTAALVAKPHQAAKPAKAERQARIKLDDLLLPDQLGDGADEPVRRPSSLVAPAPVVLKQAKVDTGSAPSVSAESLLDLTSVSPVAARNVLAPRRLASSQVSVGQVSVARAADARAATARRASSVAPVAAPVQVVNRAVPPIGAWPGGPVSWPSGTADLPLSIALGGLILALAAARGVSRMRHPQTDDPDLSFPT